MDSLVENISCTLRTLRSQKGWSLDIASQKTGVSKAMLGQIERGESSPTIATLWKIASGFDVSFSSFVENIQTHQPALIHRKKDLKQMHKNDNKIKIMPIFFYDNHLDCEIFIIELLPLCQHMSVPHQQGVIEHVLVASGEIEVFINNTWHLVKEHEGLRFSADKPHGYRNISCVPAVFHNLIHYKRVVENAHSENSDISSVTCISYTS